jgi:hypothetical protein
MNYIGIDIHKKYSVACVQDQAGKVIKRVRIEGNSAEGFRRCLNGDGEPARAVIEACWNWGKVYDTLEGIEGIEEIDSASPRPVGSPSESLSHCVRLCWLIH